jgi:hypothetical protein
MPSRQPTAPAAASATATIALSMTPTATPVATRPTAGSIEVHLLDARYGPGAAPVSAAGQVLWAAGKDSSSELWRYVPGASEPELIFSSPRRKSTISSIAASGAGYAFVEQSRPAFGDGGWRVWFLPATAAQPVELARGVAKLAGVSPFVVMDDERVVWAGFDESSPAFVTRVQMARIDEITHPTTLVERSVEDSLIWYPTLHRNELWFSTIHPRSDPTAEGPEYNLEMLDLDNATAAPVPFDGTGHDFNAAANDDYFVWKANVRGDSALNWGTLKVLERRTRDIATIPVDNANRPSIGDRFVAFDEFSRGRLSVYDPVTRTVIDLAAKVDAAGSIAVGGESVSGRLLTWYAQASGDTSPRIGWAMLPE